MSDNVPAALGQAILGSVALGYAPVIDRQRNILATRLTLAPLRAEAGLDHAATLPALSAVWPKGGEMLSPKGEALLDELLSHPPAEPVQIEVPAFIAADGARTEALLALKAAGHTLVLAGLPNAPLAPALASAFKHVTLDPGQAASAPAGVQVMHTGVLGVDAIEASFKAGAVAVIGWPMDGAYTAAPGAGKVEIAADLQVIVELMSRVDQGDDVERLEQTLKRDPSLAFKLLRYLNSAAFGLPVEVTSFRHAIMLLGYARLKRWLALLLTTASKDHNMRPIMFVRCGAACCWKELAQSFEEREMRDEMFICGLFSLLDHMLKQPFEKLLQSIPMPERVRQALVDEAGPYQPYLELVRAIEAGSLFDIRERCDSLMLAAGELNAAILRALFKASQIE